MKYNLVIDYKVWLNSQNALIDFESDAHISYSSLINQRGVLYKHELYFQFVAEGQNAGQNVKSGELFATITPREDYYEVKLKESDRRKEENEIPWLIISYIFHKPNEPGYKLREGDMLRLGKYILQVRQVHAKKDSNMKTMMESRIREDDNSQSHQMLMPKPVRNAFGMISSDQLIILRQNMHPSQVEKIKPSCRICLSDEFDMGNPLVNPCKCSGTMKYIHMTCLRQYAQSKITTQSNELVTVHSFKSLDCDICKSLLPEKVKVKNKTFQIIDLKKPETNYIILDCLIKDSNMRQIFVVQVNEDRPMKIGRSSDCDMRFTDISVSRSHAMIRLYNGDFYIKDTKSKFGTLVRMNNLICVYPQLPLYLQFGKFFFRLSVNKTFWAMITCYKSKTLKRKDYIDYFEEYNASPESIERIFETETENVTGYDPSIIDEGNNEMCDENKSANPVNNIYNSSMIPNNQLVHNSFRSMKENNHGSHQSIFFNIHIQVNNTNRECAENRSIPVNVKGIMDGILQNISK